MIPTELEPNPMHFDEDLWSFSTRLYAREGMETLCLELQDRHDINVCELLWCLWLDQSRCGHDSDLWHLVHAKAGRYQYWIIKPLRRWRRSIDKQGFWSRWRKRLAGWEIQTERKLLRQLNALTQDRMVNVRSAGSWEYTPRLLCELEDSYLRQLKDICLASAPVTNTQAQKRPRVQT